MLDLMCGVSCMVVGATVFALGMLLRKRVDDPYEVLAPAWLVGGFLFFAGAIVTLKLLLG
jgi:drug/metabolite transporter (DMT)-like permease